MSILSIDLETYSELDIKKVGGYKYAQNSEVLLMAYAFDDEAVEIIDLQSGEEIPLRVRKALLDDSIIKVAYNAQFERTVLSNHFTANNYMDGDPTDIWFEPVDWECSMVKALALGLPGNLEGVCKVLNLAEDKSKMAVGKQLINYFCKPCKATKSNGGRTRNLPHDAPEKWEQFKQYCINDVEAEREIRNRIDKFKQPLSERELWILDQEINDKGVKVDLELVLRAIDCNEQYQEKLISRAKNLTGLDNPNSGEQLKNWIEEIEGIEVKSLTKDTIPLLLNEVKSEEVKEMLNLKREMSKTSVKKYEAMKNAVCQEGRVHGLLQFYGANRTGRWAGRLVQVQNLPRNEMSYLTEAREILKSGDYELLYMLFENVPSVLSQLIRTAFIAEEKSKFIVADFSAIEARVIAWLANEKWRIDVFNTHGKIYEASASQMFKVPIETIDKHSPLRQKGKVSELALGYQGGPGALIQMGALKGGLTEEELPGLVKAWREASPNIVQTWWDAEKAAKKAIKEKTAVEFKRGIKFICKSGMLFIQLPSGRRLAYAKPRLEIEEKFNKEGITYEGMSQETKKWERVNTYGGKLVENIVQAIARDCLAVAMARLNERGYSLVMHVHDEVIAEELESDKNKNVRDACEIMGEPIFWAKELNLKAEGYETKFYKKD